MSMHKHIEKTYWHIHNKHLIIIVAVRSGLLCPPPGYLLDPGSKPTSLKSPVLTDGFFTTSTTGEARFYCKMLSVRIVTTQEVVEYFSSDLGILQ